MYFKSEAPHSPPRWRFAAGGQTDRAARVLPPLRTICEMWGISRGCHSISILTGATPPEVGELHRHDWSLGPLAKHCSRNRGKGKHGPHWSSLLGELDTPTGFAHAWDSGRGLLKEHAGKQRVSCFFPLPLSRKHVNGHQWACQQWPGGRRAEALGAQTLKEPEAEQ